MSDAADVTTPAPPAQQLDQRQQAVQIRLQRLVSQLDDHRDRIKLHMLQGLLQRAQGQRDGVRVRLLQRAENSLSSLEQSHAQSAPQFGVQGQYESLLRPLLKMLEQSRLRAVHVEEPTTFEGVLRQQEIEALRQADDDEAAARLDALLPMGELKALQEMREAWARRSTEKAVEKALQEAPEDAGPLNSHRLVVRSLMAMQDVSPDYLGRFVTQIEALLWLEQAGNRLLEKTAKPRAKTSPSSRRR